VKTKAVLFDLDGTLADTALDLGYTLNTQLALHGLPPLSAETIRPQASHGTQGLLKLGFGVNPKDPRFAKLREEYLEIYQENLSRHTRLFPGMAELLAELEARDIDWGVVTNKPARFTLPLMAALQLDTRATCVVSGDTCHFPKPHPGSLLTAAEIAGVAPQDCLYLGDAERDVEAAVAAGMEVLIANYGYLGEDDHPEKWGAHGRIDTPLELLSFLK
jgi:2-phosphoglycolate phosphatase